uniref:Uncharacterized protein n=1 Tax=Anopheles culicifacies TaxID=139723 RepID=A0A182MIT0_9DIPT
MNVKKLSDLGFEMRTVPRGRLLSNDKETTLAQYIIGAVRMMFRFPICLRLILDLARILGMEIECKIFFAPSIVSRAFFAYGGGQLSVCMVVVYYIVTLVHVSFVHHSSACHFSYEPINQKSVEG